MNQTTTMTTTTTTTMVSDPQDIRFNAITGNYYTAPIAFMTLLVPFLLFERGRWASEVRRLH